MDNIGDAHYFLLPSQGNIYTLSKITQTNGDNKVLFASLKRKLFLLEYDDHRDGCLKPIIREILFTYIPNGAEIISLDVFNKSTVCDDFFIGITIIKPNPEHSNETYLNIYSEQDLEANSELNIESIAQNCLSIDLNFIPYQLYHTQILRQFEDSEPRRETVWLLSGSDVKVHIFQEDRSNHSYVELEVDDYFSELSTLPSIVIWMDIVYTHDQNRRITAIGCECGHMQISVVDTVENTILSCHAKQFEGSVSRVQLFYLNSYVDTPSLQLISDKHRKRETKDEMAINLVVSSTLQLSAVFMDIVNQGLNRRFPLEASDKYDSVLCSCLADVDMDGEMEVIIGTYAQELLMYKYESEKWLLKSRKSLENPIQSLLYVDVTGDGMKELIVLTLGGLHVMQHNQDLVYAELQNRLKQLLCTEDQPSDEKDLNKTEDKPTDDENSLFDLSESTIILSSSPEIKTNAEAAENAGATLVGGVEIIKDIEKGRVVLPDFNVILAHTEILPDMIGIRGLLKKRFPNPKTGTLGNNMYDLVTKFKNGVTYSCFRDERELDYGSLEMMIGTLNMETQKLRDNFQELVNDVMTMAPPNTTHPFITRVLLKSPYSVEKFKLDLSPHVSKDEELASSSDEEEDENVKVKYVS